MKYICIVLSLLLFQLVPAWNTRSRELNATALPGRDGLAESMSVTNTQMLYVPMLTIQVAVAAIYQYGRMSCLFIFEDKARHLAVRVS